MKSYTIIDVDTHVTETPEVWTSRVETRFRDRVPYVDLDGRGRQAWFLNGKRIALVGLTATAGVGSATHAPKSYEQMHPGAYDARARLAYMDEMGIWAMVMYPNVAGFGNQQFLKLEDPELMLACVRAYNDWQTEWASVDPRRLLPITSTPFWDVPAAVAEIRRCAKQGHRGILFTGEPQAFGQPLIGDPHWEPLWEVATDLDLPVSFHIGSGDMDAAGGRVRARTYGRMASFTAGSVDIFLRKGNQLVDLLLSGVLARHPRIKFISVESGIGWIPFVLEALDYQFQGNRVAEEHPEFDRLPSQYFQRNVYACYWFEETAPRRLLDKVGIENVLFETDFPHPTSLYGAEVHERIAKGLGDCEPAVRRKILWENGRDLYKVEEPAAEDLARLT
jgi:predicted TIM-barrel fold metal-dependent hydrolase